MTTLTTGAVKARRDFLPWPKWGDRAGWAEIPDDVRQGLIDRAEQAASTPLAPIGALSYLDFARTGNRSAHEGLEHQRRARLAALTLGECVEGRGRFVDQLVDTLWATCEESTWVWPAHNRGGLPDVNNPYVDLGVGETAAAVSMSRYLLAEPLDAVTPLIGERVDWEVQRRFLRPYLERDDFVWMGFVSPHPNNWCPWIASNYLFALLATEDRPEVRTAGVAKALASLDRFLEGYGPDGACDEGPNYWGVAGGSLYDCLEVLRAGIDGGPDPYQDPLVGQIGRWITKVYVGGQQFLNFADADRYAGEISPHLLRTFGARIGAPELGRLAGALVAAGPGDGTPGRIGERLLRAVPALVPYREVQPETAWLPRDVWLPEGEIMLARPAEGTTDGFTLGAKGGHNDESHNHRDVGNFIVYLDAQPVVIDLGRETYRRETFNEHRYELWFTQSAFHNVPRVGDSEQGVGAEFAAEVVSYHADEQGSHFVLRLEGAYPEEAGITSWRRELTLKRGPEAAVTVSEEWELSGPSDQVEVVLMTHLPVEVEAGARRAVLGGGVTLDVAGASDLVVEEFAVDDDRLRASWGPTVRRIRVRANSSASSGRLEYWLARVAGGER
ncbi:MAG TPA: heparinase II/III family protein [Acidimicrobiales bacterium]|nr:heparinase II/III family protein [Acidimicrobiales bacterium]